MKYLVLNLILTASLLFLSSGANNEAGKVVPKALSDLFPELQDKVNKGVLVLSYSNNGVDFTHKEISVDEISKMDFSTLPGKFLRVKVLFDTGEYWYSNIYKQTENKGDTEQECLFAALPENQNPYAIVVEPMRCPEPASDINIATFDLFGNEEYQSIPTENPGYLHVPTKDLSAFTYFVLQQSERK